VVLLNVDQHNPEVKQRMTEQEFIRNNRGINGGKDLPADMLSEIYHNIKHNEMKIPDEHLPTEIAPITWKQFLNRSKSNDAFISTSTGESDMCDV
jgi:brefeldin A-resistance guanine nucleotide exchange factor 1